MTELTDQIRRYANAISDPAAIGPDPQDLSTDGNLVEQGTGALAEYPGNGQQRSRARQVASAAAIVMVIAAVSALMIVRRGGGDENVSTAPTVGRLYPLPPADAANLEVGGSPESGVGFYYDKPAGGRVVLFVYDWQAMGQASDIVRPDLAGAVPVEADPFGQAYLDCLRAPFDTAGRTGQAFLYIELNGISVEVNPTGNPDEACTPGDHADELLSLTQGLRLVDRSEWERFVRGHAASSADDPAGLVMIRLLADGGPVGTQQEPLRGSVELRSPTETIQVVVPSSGTWTGDLPPGTYTVEGFSPDMNDNRLTCIPIAPTFTITANESQSLEVICNMR